MYLLLGIAFMLPEPKPGRQGILVPPKMKDK